MDVLVIHASGTNRDHDAAEAFVRAGANPEIAHLHDLARDPAQIDKADILFVAGGFSFGDALGAGKRLGQEISALETHLETFIASGRPVLGVCNGFQALLQTKFLDPQARFHLSENAGGKFECRWVELEPNPASSSPIIAGLDAPIFCPVAHGEGRFHGTPEAELVGFTYKGDGYPANPNGSDGNIAGISSPAGNVIGMMPHPENHIHDWQHPDYRRGGGGHSGLALFAAAVRYAQNL